MRHYTLTLESKKQILTDNSILFYPTKNSIVCDGYSLANCSDSEFITFVMDQQLKK